MEYDHKRFRFHANEPLASLSAALLSKPFLDGFAAVGPPLDQATQRAVYRAGRFYPLTLETLEPLFELEDQRLIVTSMLTSIGMVGPGNLARELDRATTQAPAGRPAFHDHGLLGGLLFNLLASECEAFLAGVYESKMTGAVGTIAAAGWEVMARGTWAVRLAVESIAFHNLNFASIDPAERSRILPSGAPRKPSLNEDAHLFFISLVDTLQDWDRHHFVPQAVPPRYRPSTPARDLLLQGVGPHVRVGVRDKPNAPTEVRSLLEGWLNKEDVSRLIAHDPQYTRPNKVGLGPASDDQVRSDSSHRRRQLEESVTSAVGEARRVLIEGARDAAVNAASLLAQAMNPVQEAKNLLTASDWDALNHFIDRSALRELEGIAVSTIRPGTRLSMGSVIEQLGQGGFGTVFRVQTDEGVDSAFKLFHRTDLEDLEKRRLFRRGYDAMVQLRGHPNIVEVHTFSDLPVGFSMAYVAGPDLDRGIGQLVSAHDRLRLALTVAESVATAHAQGVLHRDIKPGNVLLRQVDDGIEPVLTDFDLAWIEGKRTQQVTTQSYATLQYGAPEQLDPRLLRYRNEQTVDVYGFGALLWFILTQEAPPISATWTDGHWLELARRLESAIPGQAIEALIAIVRRATAVKPTDRFQTMEALVDELSRVVALSQRAEQLMRPNEFRKEVLLRLSGELTDRESIQSRTGGTNWALAVAGAADGNLSVNADCTLLREPSYEGVTSRRFVTRSVKTVDERLVEFERRTGLKAQRHGFAAGAGSHLTVSIAAVPATLSAAHEVGGVLAAVARVLE